ncbi:AAA domain-containing protein [Fomitopsis serialis]|uniref:AAA domain-containing protein n=1 Tax=Fomitopsis serialis TaxID=139415 RepID=UPI002008C3FA|nr:AAA domain-containing protein [Neoantrodia serialis]KAH9917312.1 AAA domain-containing protein [Neoantrodia serialis]
MRLSDVGIDFHASSGQHRAPLQPLEYFRSQEIASCFHACSCRRTLGLRPTVPHNSSIANNTPQLSAIRLILQRPVGLAPFIIFGPYARTGKTVTVVEPYAKYFSAKRRLHSCCAPSNSAPTSWRATDGAGPDNFPTLRGVAQEECSAQQLLLSPTPSGGIFAVPALDTLAKYRVIVSTCGSASFAGTSATFVDEAGQATEAEVMTAIRPMAVPTTSIWPIIRSSAARDLGLGVSYLERLMEREAYSEQSGRGTGFVKLVKNFRSHSAILNFPSETFYANELQVCGSPSTINSFIGWPHLVNRKFPVVFHSISGQDEREASSPSYFNIDEATVVKDYIQKLKANTAYRISDEDIGIIAPYRAQVRKLRMALSGFAPDVKVASVEEFQGQERRVIILTTVRSTRDLLQYDQRYTLGFVANPRRFNVAVTRAKALLVVVGNASVLSTDPLWRRFLNYVHRNNGWRGEAISWNPTDPVQDDGEYASQLREQGVADVAAFMRRMQLYSDESGSAAEDLESGANMDMAFVEPQ